MLENSNLIEGQQAKELNKLLTDYQAVVTQLNDLDTTKKNILKRIFELSEMGVNETNVFTFKVSLIKGRETLSLPYLKEHNEWLYGKVSNYFNVGEPYRVVRSIKLKGKRV